METLIRSAPITFEILQGSEILGIGHETARKLWNYTYWCILGYNEKLRQQRGDDWDRFKRNQAYNRTGEKYPGKFTLLKELKDYWAAKNLNNRCSTNIIFEFDSAMRSWFSNVKIDPAARPPGYAKYPKQLTFEVGKNAKPLGDWTYKLTVLGRHILERHAVIRLRLAPGIKMAKIELIRLQPDGSGTIVYYVEPTQNVASGVAGIDVGIINTAVVAFQNGESMLYSGKAILDSDRYYQKRAKACKPKNWSKGQAKGKKSQRNKAYENKAGDIRKLAIHNLTRNIIDECIKRGVGTIVLGDLTGIRKDKNFGKAGNQKFHAWPFARIRQQLIYKAEEVGIEVTVVSERNTSKCCHICGQVGRREPRGLLTCRNCNVQINSDVNGAFNILNKVSPAPAYAGVGVEAVLPGLPSLSPADRNRLSGNRQISQIAPTFVAKFDLRNWSIVQARCHTIACGQAVAVG